MNNNTITTIEKQFKPIRKTKKSFSNFITNLFNKMPKEKNNSSKHKYSQNSSNQHPYSRKKTHSSYSSHSTHSFPPNPNNDNYISKLINLYYDNDKVTNEFTNNSHHKIHIYPMQRRIIVIGDLHGDLNASIECLILAKCIEPIKLPENKTVDNMNTFFNKLEWIGGDTFIVQLGDQIDRVRPQNWDENEITNDTAYKDEGSTLEIFYLFYYLDELAKKQNGRVISIIGNHEIMNTEGDFRYVSLKEFKCFKDHLASIYQPNSKFPYHSRTLKNNNSKLNKIHTKKRNESRPPNGYRERLYAFSPTGLCANMIADNNYILLQIGNWLFCHGGPVKKTLEKYDISLINNVVSMYLLGMDSKNGAVEKHYNDIAFGKGKNNILWNRRFGSPSQTINDKDLVGELNEVLDTYNDKNRPYTKATHIAIGHTPQFFNNHGINSICNGRVWRCDVGMSKAFGAVDNDNDKNNSRKCQVLEILDNGEVKVLQ
jgi:hypothetical protein